MRITSAFHHRGHARAIPVEEEREQDGDHQFRHTGKHRQQDAQQLCAMVPA
jgi:hypothetical protein